jgi:hypothetical protein
MNWPFRIEPQPQERTKPMDRIGRSVAGLLIAAGVCVAFIGCQQQTSTDTDPEPNPLEARLLEANAKRERALASHHDRCVEIFVKTEGAGDRRLVILRHRPDGFPPSLHLPAVVTTDATGGTLAEVESPWRMERVELVSLLNHETPGVYPAEGAMRPGRKAPKIRDLDDFERTALTALRNGEQVRWADTPGQIRMLGAIRMRHDCKSCHDKPEGTLLGAFTYVLKPGESKEAPQREAAAP